MIARVIHTLAKREIKDRQVVILDSHKCYKDQHVTVMTGGRLTPARVVSAGEWPIAICEGWTMIYFPRFRDWLTAPLRALWRYWKGAIWKRPNNHWGRNICRSDPDNTRQWTLLFSRNSTCHDSDNSRHRSLSLTTEIKHGGAARI